MASSVAAFSFLPVTAKALADTGAHAALWRLAHEFDAALKATDAAWLAADMDPNDLLDRIVDARASTPEGFRAKHRYMETCSSATSSSTIPRSALPCPSFAILSVMLLLETGADRR
jgi:hypothetical protein